MPHRTPPVIGKARTLATQLARIIAAPAVVLLTAMGSLAGSNTPATAPASQPSSGAAAVPNAKPRVVVDAPMRNVGVIWLGEPSRQVFRVSNAGGAPLTIRQAVPSFGCSSPVVYPQTIAPGGSFDALVEVDTQRVSGRFERWVTLLVDDPATPQVRLSVVGQVRWYVEVEPVSVAFGAITDSQPAERRVSIRNASGSPLNVTLQDRATTRPFDVSLATVEPGQRYELVVRTAPPYEKGPMRDLVTLHTNVTSQPTIQVPIFALVPERIDVQPLQLVFGQSAGGLSPPMRIIQVTNYGDSPVHVVDVSCDDPALKLSLREMRAGRQYVLEVRAPEDYVPAAPRTIILKTDDGKTPELRVPVRAVDTRPTATMTVTPRGSRATTQPTTRPRQITEAERLVGNPPPPFSLTTTTGQPLTPDALVGGVTVLNFFAPNCPFCAKQLPWMEQVRAAYTPRGVRFINVSETLHGKVFSQEQIVEKLRQLGNNGELTIDANNHVGQLFKVNSFPVLFVFGPGGMIADVIPGSRPSNQPRLEKRLEELVGILEGRTPATEPPPKPR